MQTRITGFFLLGHGCSKVAQVRPGFSVCFEVGGPLVRLSSYWRTCSGSGSVYD